MYFVIAFIRCIILGYLFPERDLYFIVLVHKTDIIQFHANFTHKKCPDFIEGQVTQNMINKSQGEIIREIWPQENNKSSEN